MCILLAVPHGSGAQHCLPSTDDRHADCGRHTAVLKIMRTAGSIGSPEPSSQSVLCLMKGRGCLQSVAADRLCVEPNHLCQTNGWQVCGPAHSTLR